jgi:hypothetical protein
MKRVIRFFEAAGDWIIDQIFPEPRMICIIFRDNCHVQGSVTIRESEEQEFLNLLIAERFTLIAILRIPIK